MNQSNHKNQLLTELENRLSVIAKLLDVYKQQMGEHRLTEIATISMQRSKEIVHELSIASSDPIRVAHPFELVIERLLETFQREHPEVKLKLNLGDRKNTNNRVHLESIEELFEIINLFLQSTGELKSNCVELVLSQGRTKVHINILDHSLRYNAPSECPLFEQLTKKMHDAKIEGKLHFLGGIGNGLSIELPIAA